MPTSALQPGDLVFFAGSDGTLTAPGHVGLYIGLGDIIDAPYTGVDVRVDSLAAIGGYVGATRPLERRPTAGNPAAASSVSAAVTFSAFNATQVFASALAGALFDPGQLPYQDQLWTRESGWNPYAINASSGALGITQALPGSKMAAAGSDYATNPLTQVGWGQQYIARRYATPELAWAHEQTFGWY